MKNLLKRFYIPIIIAALVLVVVAYLFIKSVFYPFPPEQPDQTYTLKCPGFLSNQSSFRNSFGVSVANAMTQQPSFLGILCFIEEPILNKPAILEFRFVSRVDKAVDVNIVLPKDIQVVSGNTEWKGDLKAGLQQNLRVTIKPTKVGYYHIGGGIKDNTDNHIPLAGPIGIDLDVTSNGSIVNPVWNKTFSSPDSLYSAVYPENSSWTVSQKFIDSRFTEYDFGHALSPEKFEPVISVTSYKTGYVDNNVKVADGEKEININKKNLKTKEWTYYSAIKQTIVGVDGKGFERVIIKNWNGYDIRIDLLKAEYLGAFNKFVELFTVTS